MSFDEVPQKDGPRYGETSSRRKVMALDLLSMFAKAFPEITYDLFWGSRTVNAQAWYSGEIRHVVLYGGLVRHRLVSRNCLALTLAHETGHHLGGLLGGKNSYATCFWNKGASNNYSRCARIGPANLYDGSK